MIAGDASVEGCQSSRLSEKVRAFYDDQVLLHPDNPAILGVEAGLPADCRDFFEWQEFNCLVSLHKDMHILELGCGGGRWCEHLAAVVERVIGVDLSPNAIALAQRNAAAKRLENIEYHVASIEDFQPQESYDLIYFSGVALYLDNFSLLECLAKFGARLHDSGLVVVRDSVANVSHQLCHDAGYSAQYRTVEEFEQMFSTAEFTLVGHRRAFPRECLSPLLNVWSLQSIYWLTKKLSLEKLLFRMMTQSSVQGEAAPHWLQDGYSYNHDFLLFARNGGGSLN